MLKELLPPDHSVHEDPAYTLAIGPGVFMLKLGPKFKENWQRVVSEVLLKLHPFIYQERMRK